jgi:hypothetical protein
MQVSGPHSHLAFWLSLVLLLPASLQAQGPIVAVFEMEDKGSGLTPGVLGNLTDYLGVLLTKGGYRVVPRTEIHDRLKAQKKKTYKSCYNQSCQMEMGRELTVDLGMNILPLSAGNEGDQTYTVPLLYFALGAEFCD